MHNAELEAATLARDGGRAAGLLADISPVTAETLCTASNEQNGALDSRADRQRG